VNGGVLACAISTVKARMRGAKLRRRIYPLCFICLNAVAATVSAGARRLPFSCGLFLFCAACCCGACSCVGQRTAIRRRAGISGKAGKGKRADVRKTGERGLTALHMPTRGPIKHCAYRDDKLYLLALRFVIGRRAGWRRPWRARTAGAASPFALDQTPSWRHSPASSLANPATSHDGAAGAAPPLSRRRHHCRPRLHAFLCLCCINCRHLLASALGGFVSVLFCSALTAHLGHYLLRSGALPSLFVAQLLL